MMSTRIDVLAGRGRFAVDCADCLGWLAGLPDDSIDLVFGSPPYLRARTYGQKGIARDCREWVDWMFQVTRAALRACKGLCCWVVDGTTVEGCYQPAPEGLLWKWWEQGGECWRSAIWHKNGIPGSGGIQGLRSDSDVILQFKRPGPLPWADPLATASPPKDQSRLVKRLRQPSGTYETQHYEPPALANPGNIIKATAGHLGHPLAAENEAPFPEALARFWVLSYCPPGGVVADPFTGSGTTLAVALGHGRRALGCDIRPCQVTLSRERVSLVTLPLFPG